MAFKLDSDLSAVNSILGAIGQAPVTTLNYENPEVGLIMNLLEETNIDVQSEGWYFNTENFLSFSIIGGTGADLFVFGGIWGTDTINDFEDGSDLLDFSNSSVTFVDLTISQSGNNTLIDDGLGNTITLLGITSTDITTDDFIWG